ncbi:MAG TPA: ABC transporter ATP-binding protein [Candidatus Gallacutalibacter stercoravium]|nr:ABC transporter ATP-binding protein [Candidatus Gallacutalibacter stercoravium]
MNNAIEAVNLSMYFGATPALRDVSVCFGEQKIYGLLGRNGAGKSTLLNLISNRLIPTQGSISIDGAPALENDYAQGKIYYMGEKNLLPDTSTVRDLFRWTKDFYPNFDKEYAARLAGEFGLNVKKKLKNLSTGYLTIAKLIAALAANTPYVFFDEPVLGLDANHRELFYRELIENYAENPRTIVISTHLIEEVADIVEQVVILKNGSILLDKPAEEVKSMGYCVSGKASQVEQYCAGRDVLSIESLGGLKTACLIGKPDALPNGLEVTPLDLQKLFVRLTNA